MDLVNLSVVEQRYRAVLAVERDEPKNVVAAQFGVSRQTLHTWLTRYRQDGLAGLLDRSHIDPGGKCVMLGGVANFGFAEVGANSVGQLLEPVEEGADRLFQLGAGFGGCAGGNGAFEVGIE